MADGSVVVGRTTGSDEDITYTFTFSGNDVNGNIPDNAMSTTPSTLGGDNAQLAVSVTTQGTEITGSFTLALDGLDAMPALTVDQTSADISVTAAATGTGGNSVTEKLEALTDVATGITVTRSGPDNVGGYSWTVVYDGNDGNLPDFACESSSGDPLTAPGANVECNVCPTIGACTNGTYVTGLVNISLPDFGYFHLHANHTCDELEDSIASETTTDVGTVSCLSRVKYPATGVWNGGYTWTLQFVTAHGNLTMRWGLTTSWTTATARCPLRLVLARTRSLAQSRMAVAIAWR